MEQEKSELRLDSATGLMLRSEAYPNIRISRRTGYKAVYFGQKELG